MDRLIRDRSLGGREEDMMDRCHVKNPEAAKSHTTARSRSEAKSHTTARSRSEAKFPTPGGRYAQDRVELGRNGGGYRKTILAVLAGVLLAVALLVVNPSLHTANADGIQPKSIGYESILVHRGETLTSIAVARTDGSKQQVQRFIEETTKMNGINPDRITAGNYICVPVWK